ncbi:MAG TPA: DHA2 family efflux MFS transporter permease subunit, partial [Acidimicrobiales bacterium]|nr:DHA2 family efflux MFS transporter permease subunit [Acidimicrobiales bacterium]
DRAATRPGCDRSGGNPVPSSAMPGRRGPVLDPALRRLAVVVVLGSIMSILDATIVAVAINTLGREFHTSVDTIQWVSTGYLLALSAVIPLTGWAVDRFGHKRIWMGSLTLFLVGSVLCGLSWSAGSLIAFRVLQGIGGGMIMPVGQSLLARAAGPQRMGRVMSVVGVPTVMGPVLGPVLGGLIIDSVTWRWIFFVNVPIGIAALALSVGALEHDGKGRAASLDWLGVSLLSPGLIALVYGLSKAGASGGFGQTTTLASIAIGALLLVAFVIHSARADRPLLDIRLFRDQSFAVAGSATFLVGASLFAAMFLMPLYYQVARGQSALVAGLLMAPQGIGAAMVMRGAGAVADRSGARRIVPAGVVLMALGSFAFTQVGANTSEVLLALALLVRGMGLGIVMMPVIAAGYMNLSREAVPRATTVINILQRVGGSIATALVAVVLQRQISAAFPGGAGFLSTGGSASGSSPSPQAEQLMAQAFAHTFWWVFAMVALIMVPALLLPKRSGAKTFVGEVEGLEDSRGSSPDETLTTPELA